MKLTLNVDYLVSAIAQAELPEGVTWQDVKEVDLVNAGRLLVIETLAGEMHECKVTIGPVSNAGTQYPHSVSVFNSDGQFLTEV